MTVLKNSDLQSYRTKALAELAETEGLDDLEVWYRRHLGKSGEVTARKKQIGQQPPEKRREFGQDVNAVSNDLVSAFEGRKEEIKLEDLRRRVAAEVIDVTLPARPRPRGRLHPISATLREVREVFGLMGFLVFDSPHVESDENNFQLLNIPAHHPARDMQDTFYVSEDVVLRTHTSPGQIRAMRALAPDPVRVILPGLCYRHEQITPRSEIQFHQVEGLLIGPQVRLSDLKGVLVQFARMVFGADQDIRMRGSYFPFTEPSVEVDIKCNICRGEGCRMCKFTGWLELLGAGLVHPQVLKNGGYDPKKMRGIAFGMGIERIVLLRHQIDDIRYFYQNDLRFLSQFS